MTTHDPFEQWADEVAGDLVQPLDPDQVQAIARAAASATAATSVAAAGALGAAATGGAAGVSVTAKVVAAVALTVSLGAGAAVLGVLPDPIQSWVADLADGIGIDLPRPDDAIDLPGVTVPDVTVPAVTVPDVTVTTVDLDVLP